MLSENGRQELLDGLQKSDLWLLNFPLYIDATPYMVVKWMEWITSIRDRLGNPEQKKILVTVNCGFPEASHNKLALQITEEFSHAMGLQWLGGLSLGGGEAIKGEPLESKGGMASHVISALDITAEAILSGKPMPEEAKTMMSKSFIPNWLYTLVGEFGWRQQAKKHGKHHDIKNKPYDKP